MEGVWMLEIKLRSPHWWTSLTEPSPQALIFLLLTNVSHIKQHIREGGTRTHVSSQAHPAFGTTGLSFTKCMQQDTKKDSHDVLSKFLYWAMFIAVLGHLKSRGCRLDIPARCCSDNSSFVFCLVFSLSLCVGGLRQGL